MTTHSRAQTIERIDRARTLLDQATTSLDDAAAAAIQVTPQWNGADILRHAVAWNELTRRCLDDWNGSRPWLPFPDPSFDTFNQRLVNERAHLTVAMLAGELRAAYERYLAILSGADDELAAAGAAPWGEQVNRLHLIYEIVGHDEEHLTELLNARR